MEHFYQCLFDPSEQVCWGLNKFGVDVEDVANFAARAKHVFFSINPLKDRRLDANVTCYRNILCEFDSGTIESQLKLIRESGLPYSTIVYSGGKSLHVIVSLQEPFTTEAEYRAQALAIYGKLGGRDVVDYKTQNPSRFSRTPGAIRDGIVQELIEVKGRVAMADVKAWAPITTIKYDVEALRVGKILKPTTNHFLLFGASNGNRNGALYSAALDMLRAGYNEEDIYNRGCRVSDLPLREIRATIKSARNTLNRTGEK